MKIENHRNALTALPYVQMFMDSQTWTLSIKLEQKIFRDRKPVPKFSSISNFRFFDNCDNIQAMNLQD